ncbi:hypothetical protein BJY04DRAFT_216838 [Aspergillus karnatakaensis]|uniref:uncharacterized protein n=1 Tax=Aspergillus karnatakaensis TaxID=1810916 RepID=UPI003CCD0687
MDRLHRHVPYAQWRLHVLRRLYSVSLPRHESAASSNTIATPDDTGKRNNTENNDTAKPSKSPSQLLPQSPLLRYPYPFRKVRHRRKARPTYEDKLALDNNPWAVALASSIRQCNVTGARVPKHLLTEWGLIEQPITTPEPTQDSEPESNSAQTPNTTAPKKPTRKQQPSSPASKLWLLPISLLSHALERLTHKSTSNRKAPPPLKIRMVERSHILESLSNAVINSRQNKHTPIWQLVPHRWKYPKGPLFQQRDELRITWRTDMPEFVLRMMRQEAVERLKGTAKRYNTINEGVWREIDLTDSCSKESMLRGISKMEISNGMERGVGLYMGNGVARSVPDDGATPLSSLATLPGTDTTKVPVFDLTRLFSQVELDQLRDHSDLFKKPALFLTPPTHIPTLTILALWKLEGYMRDPHF